MRVEILKEGLKSMIRNNENVISNYKKNGLLIKHAHLSGVNHAYKLVLSSLEEILNSENKQVDSGVAGKTGDYTIVPLCDARGENAEKTPGESPFPSTTDIEKVLDDFNDWANTVSDDAIWVSLLIDYYIQNLKIS